MYAFIALIVILCSAWTLARWLGARGAELAVLIYVLATCLVLGYGYTLASADLLGTPAAWCIIAAAGGMLACMLRRWPLPSLTLPEAEPAPSVAPRWERAALILVGGTVCALAVLNLLVVLFTLRPNHDSMSCHLPRTIHFWQQGNLDNYVATHWAQTSHPRHHPILMGFWFMVGGENLMQMVHYLSYWALIAATYGIGRRLGVRPSIAALSALVGGLLTNMLMICTTTQNDMIIAAGLGAAVHLLLAFRATRAVRFLVLVPLPVALLLGVKASAVMCGPSLAVVALYALWPTATWSRQQSARAWAMLVGAGVVACVVLVLPSGYLLTWRTHGSPMGPLNLSDSHTMAGASLDERLAEGGKSLLRFLVEFTYLDGLPPHRRVHALHHYCSAGIKRCTQALGIDLVERGVRRGVRHRPPFSYRDPAAHEDRSSWGILGIALLAPAIAVALCRPRLRPGLTTLAASWLVFLLVQSFSQPYDPWRGRYFLWATALAAPVAALLLEWLVDRPLRALCLIAVLGLGCFSAATAVLFRASGPIWHGRDPLTGQPCVSVFARDRIDQLTAVRPVLAPALRRFEELVPVDATVRLHVGDPFEYAYLGPAITRRIEASRKPAPASLPAHIYYLYAADNAAHSADILLGVDVDIMMNGALKKNIYLRLPRASGA